MARFATTAVIAGVTFTGCRVTLVDAQELLTQFIGSSEVGNDGSVNDQFINVGVKGKTFGVKMDTAESTKIQSVLAALNSAEADRTTFVVHIVDFDGLYDINVNCGRDKNANPWINHDGHSEGWLENVVMRFQVHSAV
jgi:hypothetical protein